MPLRTYDTNRRGRTQVAIRCARCRTRVPLPKAQTIIVGTWMWVKKERFTPVHRITMFQVPRTKSVYGCIDCSMELLYQKEPPQPPISGPKNEKHFLEV